jgi:dolichol-phosphate mannosyltransferase
VNLEPPFPRSIVILPAYNEEGKIGRVVTKVLRDPPPGLVETCLVVDDGSRDRTVGEAREAGAQVLVKAANGGVGSAIREGLLHARAGGYQIAIVMAGDDQDVPAEIPAVLEPILSGGYDFVQGSRRLHGLRTTNMPLFRRVTTWIYSLIFRLATGFPCTDGTNGFRAFRLSVLDDPRIVLDQRWLDTYELEPYLFYRVARGGYRVCEAPVTKHYHKGVLSYSKMVPIRDWWRILRPLVYLRLGLRR